MSGEGPANRGEMVEAARKFMMTTKVRDTPFEEQRQFLLGKGVTESEIAEARASLPAQMTVPVGNHQGVYPPPPPPSTSGKVISAAQSILVLGSVSFAGYRFLRSYVLPKFFDIPDPATEELRLLQGQVNELQNSIKFVMDSVSQTTQALATQQQEIAKALHSISGRDADLSRVEAGISTIKSLLLSQNNIAPIVTPKVTSLPSWQNPPANSLPANAGASSPTKDDYEEFVDTLTDNGGEA